MRIHRSWLRAEMFLCCLYLMKHKHESVYYSTRVILKAMSDLAFCFCFSDADWCSFRLSSGGRGRGEDASLLSFRKQRHFSQQV